MTIDKKIEKLEKEFLEKIQKLKDELKEENDSIIWKPKNKDKFYSYSLDGVVEFCISDAVDRGYFDRMMKIIEIGNYYKTKEEAEFKMNAHKYNNLFQKYINEHQHPGYKQTEKTFIIFDEHTKEMRLFDSSAEIDIVRESKMMINGLSLVVADAINFIGSENFIKYILEC